MKKKVITLLQYLFFLLLGVFFVWWSLHKMDEKTKQECFDALGNARYILFLPVAVILIMSHLSRAMRWRILMQPMGYSPRLNNTFFAVMIGYLANLAVPRLGEVLKCTLLARYEKVPPDKLVGTILVERAVDVFSLLMVFVIAIITQANIIGSYAKITLRKYLFTGSITSILIKAGIGLLLLLVIFFLLRFVFKKYEHIGLIKKIKSIVKGVSEGLLSIKNLDNKWAFIGHTLFIWACYIGGTYLGFSATEATSHLPFVATFPILAFASIGMIIAPGGIGFYAFFIMEVMGLYHIDKGPAYANGTLQWMAQTFIILIVGCASALAFPYFNKTDKTVSAIPIPDKV